MSNKYKLYRGNDWYPLATLYEIQQHESKIASTSQLGHVLIGDNIEVDSNGKISIKNATTSNRGVVQIVDNLNTNDATRALTARQGYELKSLIDSIGTGGSGQNISVEDTLGSSSTTDALSANKGRELKELLDNNEIELDDLRTFVNNNIVSGGIPVTQNEKDEWNSKSNFNGDYDNLINKPVIPALNDTLTSTSASESLSARQGKILKDTIDNLTDFSGNYEDLVNKPTIPTVTILNDTLTSTSSTEALTANKGKELKDLVDTKANASDLNALETIVNNMSGGTGGGGLTLDDIPNATPTQRGFMTSADKVKLSTISSGANFVQVEDSLTSISPTSALSAKQGNEISNQIGLLTDEVDAIKVIIQTLQNQIAPAESNWSEFEF